MKEKGRKGEILKIEIHPRVIKKVSGNEIFSNIKSETVGNGFISDEKSQMI